MSPNLIARIAENKELFLLDVEKKELKDFATTGQSHGNIPIGRDLIFIASTQGHKILLLNKLGELISTYEKDNPETKDGSIGVANFTTQQGLAFSPDQQILYVSEIQNGTLRSIMFNK